MEDETGGCNLHHGHDHGDDGDGDEDDHGHDLGDLRTVGKRGCQGEGLDEEDPEEDQEEDQREVRGEAGRSSCRRSLGR